MVIYVTMCDVSNVVYVRFMQLRQAKSTEEIQEVLSSKDYSFLFECGYSKPSITLADIQELLRTVWLHHTVYRVYGEIQQLKDGIVNTLKRGSGV